MKFYDSSMDSTNQESQAFAEVNSCGRQLQLDCDYTVTRPAGRLDYHIVYLKGGRCVVEYQGVQEALQSGEFVLYPPGEPQRYVYLKEEHPEALWVHFTGQCIPEILRENQLTDGGIYHMDYTAEFEEIFARMIREYQMRRQGFRGYMAGLLVQLAAAYGRSSAEANTSQAGQYARLAPVIEQIHNHYHQPVDLEAYAALCGLSKSRFVHVFKETVGISPYHYQLNIRLERARELLCSSDLNVSEVGAAVGYGDPLYFSRLFKQYMGCSPAMYARRNKII